MRFSVGTLFGGGLYFGGCECSLLGGDFGGWLEILDEL
jgi:hypothetical protein